MRKIIFMLFAFSVCCDTSGLVAQVPVPAVGCYHAAFTPYANGHKDFETLAKKEIAIEMDYRSWASYPDFPVSNYNTVRLNNAIPHCTWEPWNGDMNNSSYSNQAIISGFYDAYILRWALQIKVWGFPLMLRWGHEMNGNWYPWDGVHSGGATTAGFGDPLKPDGPERYIAAYRHIHHLFDSVGVKNAAWLWCPNNGSSPNEPWNQPENYYPGDDVVDWIAIDGYNWGTSQSWSRWTNFYDVFKEIYNKFKLRDKPMMIGEFASTEAGGSKAQWITGMLMYLKAVFPKIKAITWFHINKETDWRINSSADALAAYQTLAADPYFISSTAMSAENVKAAPSPSGISIEAPFPNPFNGAAVIQFSISAPMHVTIDVWNILGTKIACITEKEYSAGKHSIHWFAKNESGNDLPGGVYFIRASSDGKYSTQKITYIK